MYILQSYYIEEYEPSDISVIAISESLEALKALAIESNTVFDQQWSKSQNSEYYELTTSLPNEYPETGFMITPVKMI